MAKKGRFPKFVTLYRIQGGADSKSKYSISVGSGNDGYCRGKILKKGRLACSHKVWIYIADSQHLSYFLPRRIFGKDSPIENINDIDDTTDLRDRDIQIISMHVSHSFFRILEKYSIKQLFSSYNVKGHKRCFKPKVVDKTTPGLSYGIHDPWTRLLEAFCYYATCTEIQKKSDIFEARDGAPNIDNFRELDIEQIVELMKKCEISDGDISETVESLNIESNLIRNYQGEIS